MSEADVVEFVGFLFVAYAGGWVSGFLILTFRKFAELI